MQCLEAQIIGKTKSGAAMRSSEHSVKNAYLIKASDQKTLLQPARGESVARGPKSGDSIQLSATKKAEIVEHENF